MSHLVRPEPFFDRKDEIAALRAAWKRRGAGFAVLYGRRRLGKTYMLQHFVAGLHEQETLGRCYYLADQSTAETQRLAFADRLLEAFPSSTLQPADIAASWRSLLRYFTTEAQRAAKPGGAKAVVILDEFPYLVAQSPELPSILQAWWDQEGLHAPVFVVLCGSHLSVMAALANQTAPLHGRFNAGRIRLQPMTYADVAEFYAGAPSYGPKEKLLMYGAFGGTPRYHALADPNLPWDEQIVDLLLRPGAPFESEAQGLLVGEQIRDPAPYNAILGAIARGCTRHVEIQNATGITAAAITHPLNVLQELEWVKKERAFGETSDRRSIYRIADPFLLFWYRFGAPLASALRFDDPMTVFRKRIEPVMPGYMGENIFEAVCTQWLRKNARTQLDLAVLETGRYWSRDSQTEIDIVAQLESGQKLFAECKWSAGNPIGISVYATLRAKVESLPDPTWKQNAQFALFSLGGFTQDLRHLAKSHSESRLHLIDAKRLFL